MDESSRVPVMTNENSRDWLLENSALPLIETMLGKRVSFHIDLHGRFFINPGGYISDGGMCSGGIGAHGDTCKDTVDSWIDYVASLPEDKHWTASPYEDSRRFKVSRFGDLVVIAQVDEPSA